MAATRRGRVVLGALVLVVAAAAGITVKALWTTAKDRFTADHCTIGAYDLDTSQTAVAATMTAAVTSYKNHLPDRAAVLVLAAGLQESKLRNLPPGAGDRDSVGVLQQRPSQGWGNGDVNLLQNVFKATTEFLDHLVNVPNSEHLTLAKAVQDVQNSADESAYAKHEPEAKALAQALLGRTATGVTCSFAKPTKVATATAVVSRVTAELPVNTPTVSGARITVPGAAWQTVAWFVSYADRFGIDSVSYNGKQWTRTKGWHASKTAPRTAVVATMATVKND
jgi:hypothetical protein